MSGGNKKSGDPTISTLSARQVECLQRMAVGESSLAASPDLSARMVDHYNGDAWTHLAARLRANRLAGREAIHWMELRAETFQRACEEVATQQSQVEQAW